MKHCGPQIARRRRSADRFVRASHAAFAFTLVEMVVVVAVILVLVSLVVPAASALWEQRKISDARNTLEGLLASARMRSLQADGVESGLFFYLDQDGVQRIATIEQAEPQSVPFANVFKITGDRDQVMPAPMRAVPRYIVEPDLPGKADDPDVFQFEEVAIKDIDFARPPAGIDPAQRHRNFFTVVYSAKGELLVKRDVLILDPDSNNNDEGDRTGLQIGADCSRDNPQPKETLSYFTRRNGVKPLDPLRPTVGHVDLITDCSIGQIAAINFPSVDGVLVYDDAILNRLRIGVQATDGREMKTYLTQNAQPFYIGRSTGSIIVGPVGTPQIGVNP